MLSVLVYPLLGLRRFRTRGERLRREVPDPAA
jgi:hypothetical protein